MIITSKVITFRNTYNWLKVALASQVYHWLLTVLNYEE